MKITDCARCADLAGARGPPGSVGGAPILTGRGWGGWGACREVINLVGDAVEGRSFFMLALRPIDAKKPPPIDFEELESDATDESKANVREERFRIPTP